uniref:mRNA m(6)A methyltransferase n=1 Tax=Picocystis salinarum TaxID=88271 RepID=A0A6U9QP54_9CHLO
MEDDEVHVQLRKKLEACKEEEAMAEWEGMGEEELDREIQAWRYMVECAGNRVKEQGGDDREIRGDEDNESEPGHTHVAVDELDPAEWQVPPHCIPIHANVTTYDFDALAAYTQFDAIMMDPPWQLATANPTRGVALGYFQLNDHHIMNLPVPKLQTNGFLFVWVINAKYKFTLDLFRKWGYQLVDQVVWVKMTVNRRLAKSHGYYLQHAKEVCLVGRKGDLPPGSQTNVGSDVIFSERRGQSQKPEEIYQLIEKLVPNGRYLEIFARKNNLRNYWVSLGNEVTGMGLPEEDMTSIKAGQGVANASTGRRKSS